jgi:hypothetical protein
MPKLYIISMLFLHQVPNLGPVNLNLIGVGPIESYPIIQLNLRDETLIEGFVMAS